MHKRSHNFEDLLPAKRRKPNADADLDPITVSLDVLPLEILGNHIFNFFCFDIWLRIFTQVSKRWLKACEVADVNKQITLDLSPSNHAEYIQCLKRYNVQTLILLNWNEINLITFLEILTASKRLHTLALEHFYGQTVFIDHRDIKGYLIQGITTLSVGSSDIFLLDLFPDVARLEIRGDNFDIEDYLNETDRSLSSIKEIAVNLDPEFLSLNKFPNLQRVIVYAEDIPESLQQSSIPYTIIYKNIISPITPYHQCYLASQRSPFFEQLHLAWLESADEELTVSETAIDIFREYSSFEYEIDLVSRAFQYHFPSMALLNLNLIEIQFLEQHARFKSSNQFDYKKFISQYYEAFEQLSLVLPYIDWPFWPKLTIYACDGTKEQTIEHLKTFKGQKKHKDICTPALLFNLISETLTMTELSEYLPDEIIRELVALREEDGSDIIAALSQNGIDMTRIEGLDAYIEDWNVIDKHGNTPLRRALKARYPQQALYLMNKGGHLGNNRTNMIDIRNACAFDWNLMKPFINQLPIDWQYFWVEEQDWPPHGTFDPTIEDREGHALLTILYVQSYFKFYWAQQSSVNFNHVDSSGNTLLTYAVSNLPTPIPQSVLTDIDKLFDYGVDVNQVIQSKQGRTYTALSLAVSLHHKSLAELFISRGADVTFIDGKGNNLMHLLCKKIAESGAGLVSLLAKHVDVNHKNNHGHTPLQCAKNKNVPWIEELIKHGAQ